MSEPIELKSMPLASVIYLVTFDGDGRSTTQGAIYADITGCTRFEGDSARCYLMLQQAVDTLNRVLALSLTERAIADVEQKRLLNSPLSSL